MFAFCATSPTKKNDFGKWGFFERLRVSIGKESVNRIVPRNPGGQEPLHQQKSLSLSIYLHMYIHTYTYQHPNFHYCCCYGGIEESGKNGSTRLTNFFQILTRNLSTKSYIYFVNSIFFRECFILSVTWRAFAFLTEHHARPLPQAVRAQPTVMAQQALAQKRRNSTDVLLAVRHRRAHQRNETRV